VGEFDDSALMKVFGQAGSGVFIAPSAIANEVAKQYGVEIIGNTDEVREQFYAISVERRISHPAVVSITETAREWLK
jgi:LysR family transcriptional activator of nhaA